MISLILLVLMSSKVAVVTSGAFSAKQAEIASKLTSSAKGKLDGIAKDAPASESEARMAIKEAFPDASLSDSDLTTLTFYVMADVSSSVENELKAISKEIDKMRDQKRDVQKSLEGKNEPATLSKVKAIGPHDYYRAPSALAAGTPPPKLMERLSELGAMTEANQSKMAELASQKSRFESMLSGMVGKMTTDWSALQNLK